MNYLYSAFFCPPCQSLHDMYVYACMYIYDIWYMYIYECADDCNKPSSIITSYYVCEKEVTENPSVRREDGHGECSVSLAAVLLAITNKARCRRLRVVTVIDITCHCCCCCVLLFFSVSEIVSVPVVKLTNYDFILFPAIFFIWHLPLYLYDWSPTQMNLPSIIQCGASPPAAIAGIPTFVGSRHYDSFADRAPVYFTCGCPALKWVWESRP